MVRSAYKNKKTRKRPNRSHLPSHRGKRTRNRNYYRLKGGSTATPMKKAVVFVLDPDGGFFSIYYSILRVYVYAKKLNLPFFIDHHNWQYTYKDGWHDYLKSFNSLNKEDKFDLIEYYRNGATNEVIGELTMAEFIEAIKETFILQDHIQQSIDSYIEGIGGEYTSLYVRRGDKIQEAPFISLDEILTHTTIKDDGRKIFVQTDDYSIVTEMRSKFPSCSIMTLTKENATGADNNGIINMTPEERKTHTEELLISCVISARASIGWVYYLSNVGTFIKLLGFDHIHVYLEDKYASQEEIDNTYRLESKYKDILAASEGIRKVMAQNR